MWNVFFFFINNLSSEPSFYEQSLYLIKKIHNVQKEKFGDFRCVTSSLNVEENMKLA